MKKLTGIFFLLFTVAFAGHSQKPAKGTLQEPKGPSPQMMERLKVEKISFLATHLDLTPSEAEVFWPVYNEFERKRLKIEMDKREIESKINRSPEAFSEEESKKMCNDFVATFDEEARLMKEYNARFMNVLPVQKVIRFYQAERKFRSFMLQEFRRREPNRHDRPNGTDKQDRVPDRPGSDSLPGIPE